MTFKEHEISKKRNSRSYVLYILFISIIILLLYLKGIFPIAKPFQNQNYVNNKNETSLFNTKHRIVIMVIDAWRRDFVDDTKNMPYLCTKINEDGECLLTIKVEPPTVTMPRIKALMTGTIPDFIDIILNLGSSELSTDNLLYQALNNDLKLIFYGDETWLKLFPKYFIRSEGTTSFFVSDYTEVDNNITRHLKTELLKNDWDMMILHYLGLDHIGHLFSPKSNLVRPKLLEMDSIIEMIHKSLLEWEKTTTQKSLFLICGDHGMKDTGSHGGASLSETLVPLAVLGASCQSESNEAISQIDVAPTLSAVLGLHFPTNSIGKLIRPLLKDLPPKDKLSNYQIYFKHMQTMLETSNQNIDIDIEKIYNNAWKLHTAWINNNSYDIEQIIDIYENGINKINSALKSLNNYDIYLLIYTSIALILCLIFLCTEMYTIDYVFTFQHYLMVLIAFLTFNALNFVACSFFYFSSYLCWSDMNATLINGFVLCNIIFITSLIYLNKNTILSIVKNKLNKDRHLKLMLIGYIVYVISLTSSSFIEEEHQTWYFYWSSISVYILYCKHIRIKKYDRQFFDWIILMGLHRIIRRLNQTGDKWAHVPDISDWLNKDENNVLLSVYFILGLFLIFYSMKSFHSGHYLNKIFISMTLVTLYTYKCRTENLLNIFMVEKSKGIFEAQLVFILIIITFLILIIMNTFTKRKQNKTDVLSSFIICWILLNCLLMRTHNVILLPVIIITLKRIEEYNFPFSCVTILYMWVGNTFYFYQGNSNSLASIDLAAGFIGQKSYEPVYVGLLLTIHTYSMPCTAYLMLVDLIKQKNISQRSEALYIVYKMLTFDRLLCMSIYCIQMTFQLEHLFIWSVFSPKLIYEAFKTILILVFLLCIEIYVLICKIC